MGKYLAVLGLAAVLAVAQDTGAPAAPVAPQSPVAAQAPAAPAAPLSPQAPAFKERQPETTQGTLSVAAGTHVLCTMVNSVSTKQALVGDRLYLETSFPISVGNTIVIPQGSWVTGTVIEVTRAKRAKRAGSMKVRFDALTLPNGVTRNFRSDLGSLDSRDGERLNGEQGNVSGGSGKGDAAKTVAITTASGAGLGTAVGAGLGHVGAGIGAGAGAGAAAGLATVLLSHGAEATLNKGSTVEMVLDRPLTFEASDLDFHNAPPAAAMSDGGPHGQAQQHRGWPGVPW